MTEPATGIKLLQAPGNGAEVDLYSSVKNRLALNYD